MALAPWGEGFLAAPGIGTWGISGSTFVAAYLLLAAVVGVSAVRARRAIADPLRDRVRDRASTRPDRPVGDRPARDTAVDVDAHPHDVAYLNGGAELAVTSALSSMHLRGTVAPLRGQLQAVGRLDPGTDPLERAVHLSAATLVRRGRLPQYRAVATALAAIEERLVDAGLLLSGEQSRRMRGVGWWLAAVAALGLIRVLAVIAEARPDGFLLAAALAVAAVAMVQLLYAPRRSRTGDRTLAALRASHHDLAPDVRPDWVAYGPAGAALGVGIFGAGAVWASDPAFAGEIAVQRAAAGRSGDGGASFSGGDGGGGGGGCGGGGGGCGG